MIFRPSQKIHCSIQDLQRLPRLNRNIVLRTRTRPLLALQGSRGDLQFSVGQPVHVQVRLLIWPCRAPLETSPSVSRHYSTASRNAALHRSRTWPLTQNSFWSAALTRTAAPSHTQPAHYRWPVLIGPSSCCQPRWDCTLKFVLNMY